MTSCWEVVKIIKGVVNDQNIYRVKLRGILSLFKKSSPMNSKNSGEESQTRES